MGGGGSKEKHDPKTVSLTHFTKEIEVGRGGFGKASYKFAAGKCARGSILIGSCLARVRTQVFAVKQKKGGKWFAMKEPVFSGSSVESEL